MARNPFGWDYPPPGCEHHPDAPWNQKEAEDFDILWQCQSCGLERPLPMNFRANEIKISCPECGKKILTLHKKVLK